MTAEANAQVRFRRAIERRALWMAEDAAREPPNLSLEDALQLVHLYSERGSPKYEKAALRWLERYLTQNMPRLRHFREEIKVTLAGLAGRRTPRIGLVRLAEGVHHVTFLTEDLDRLVAFYERVFDARRTLDMTEEGVRHVFLEVGPTTVLHPFQFLDGPPLPQAPGAMFQRGRLDHFALLAPSQDAFVELRRRIETEGAADGDVRDMKTMWIMGFHDPDGFYVEVIWRKPDLPDTDTLPRSHWTNVELTR